MKVILPLLICAALFGCGRPLQDSVEASGSIGAQDQSRLRLELPQRYEHWRADFLADWQEVQVQMESLAARWPETSGPAQSLTLTITASPPEAQFLSDRLALPGDPQVPRTHPGRRLALITLPRDDRLLASRAHPPRTLRETARHEMAHLLACDRPGLAQAPAWFHEGLAEALVGLQPTPYPNYDQYLFGSSWVQPLLAYSHKPAGFSPPLHDVLAKQAAEVCYSARACLVQQLLMKVDGLEPWKNGYAHPPLDRFLARLPEGYGSEDPVPLPRGREIDFYPGGKNILLASLPLRSVILQAGKWTGEDALDFDIRVGRTGAAMAGILLRSAADTKHVFRVRMNTFGAAVASLEALEHSNARAYQSRPEPGAVADWRSFSLNMVETAGGPPQLRISSRDYQRTFSADFLPPYQLEFYVIDGVCEVRSANSLLPPKNRGL